MLSFDTTVFLLVITAATAAGIMSPTLEFPRELQTVRYIHKQTA